MARTDMVRAYTESLLEQVIGAEKVKPDHDGDYPVRFESALYWVRIDPGPRDDPTVRVFAIAVDKVDPVPGLYECLNEINTQLRFARAFWVGGQVLIESEMPGESLSLAGFSSACNMVAQAADHFGPRLASQFGGRTAFEDEKGDGYKAPDLGYGTYV